LTFIFPFDAIKLTEERNRC